jgi:tRNA A37 threonylcarbamoyladenosine dehydratase
MRVILTYERNVLLYCCRQDKCVILDTCRFVNMPVVTVGAAGGKGDPTKITAVDLSRVEYDNLLFQVRVKHHLRLLYTALHAVCSCCNMYALINWPPM